MKKLFFVLALMAAIILGLAACGGGSESDTGGGNEGPVTLDFKGEDILFDITEATVPTGVEVTINFDNVGTLEHSWVLTPPDVDPLAATEADALAGANSGTVPGGESTTFTFIAPAPGEYPYVCTVPGHAAAGMVGTLTVTN